MNSKFRFRKLRGEIRVEIGKRRERLFIEAWKRQKTNPNKPIWFSSVRKATFIEDTHDHVDAYLIRTDGYEIPVQIKGNLPAVREHARKWHATGNCVVIVVIRENDTDDIIIWETLRALDRLKSELESRDPLSAAKKIPDANQIDLEKRLSQITAYE